jgi:hypothetical protein
MRYDMDKVIVERPRRGGGVRRPKGNRKREKMALAGELPMREGIGCRWTSFGKWLNEHLSPLRRYLQSQVGRPWDKVYSEICQHIKLDSAVQSHVLDHLWDYVEVHTQLCAPTAEIAAPPNRARRQKDRPVVCNSRGEPIGRGWPWVRRLFYVCPKSGVLKQVPTAPPRRSWRQLQPADQSPRIVVSNSLEWRKLKGLWFEITLAPAAEAPRGARDVLERVEIHTLLPGKLNEWYGRSVYALAKRQMNKREVRAAEERWQRRVQKRKAESPWK